MAFIVVSTRRLRQSIITTSLHLHTMLKLRNSKRTTLSYLLHSRLFDIDVIETDLCGKGSKRDERVECDVN
jgi:hypothetical protein